MRYAQLVIGPAGSGKVSLILETIENSLCDLANIYLF